MRHQNQVALVTGGTQGIGKGIAQKLQQEGAHVIVASRKATAKNTTDGLVYKSLDVTDPQAISDLFNWIEQTYAKLDILVNNAGMMVQKHFLETQLEDWDKMMAVNLRGVFLCSQFAAKLMAPKKAGVIINMGSVEGMANNPDHVPYAASKSGVHGLSRAIAVDMGSYGVRCNTVCPGWIDTPLNQAYFDALSQQEKAQEAIRQLHPLKQTGKPEDVANLVSWLASAEAQWVTGQSFTVDGGRMAQLSGVDFDRFA